MDFIEKKLIEIIQFNTDKIKEEEIMTENDETKFKNLLEKVSGTNKYILIYLKIICITKIFRNI
jgi:hypothetical protein